MESWLSSRTGPTILKPPLSISGTYFLKVDDLPFRAVPAHIKTSGRFMVHNLIKTIAPRTAQFSKVSSPFVQPVEIVDRKFIDDYLIYSLTVISCAAGRIACPFWALVITK